MIKARSLYMYTRLSMVMLVELNELSWLRSARHFCSNKYIYPFTVITSTRRYYDSSCLLVCSFVCSCVGNGWRYKGSVSVDHPNGIWRIDWSRNRQRHVTRYGRSALRVPGGDFGLLTVFINCFINFRRRRESISTVSKQKFVGDACIYRQRVLSNSLVDSLYM